VSSSMLRPPPRPTPFPYTTLFRSTQAFWRTDPARWASRLVDSRLLEAQLLKNAGAGDAAIALLETARDERIALSGAGHPETGVLDRKSTRLNSSHVKNSYAVFCLK